MSASESPYVTPGQAASILGVSRATVYRMVREGRVTPSVVSPQGMLFSRAYIQDYAGSVAQDSVPELRRTGAPVEGS